ncbi:Cerato-platanin [Boletus edulis BED1]|uniref:Cerato-platanin n=1 Tax=Boletus edulis BED1 TaxID=1328754 RepID=A0AAD4BQZ7_BOLED|nr:Cerato-platanin [Boletus edulis BED1]
MKLLGIAAALSLVTPTVPLYTVLYDTFYDGTQISLSSVACSTGQYGLITQGYNIFGDLPSYPFIGGAPLVEGWNSPYCGTCWNITYTNPQGSTFFVIFTAINTGNQGGFTISFAGMDTLTNGNALRLDGMISASATQISERTCATAAG